MAAVETTSQERRRQEISSRRFNGTPSREYAELDVFEREYTIERFTQRDLMLNLGTLLWLVTLIVALTAGTLSPNLSTPFPTSIRYLLAALSAGIVVFHLTALRRLDDQRTSQAVFVFCVTALVTYFVLSFYGPGALGGMTVAVVAVAIFSAQFLGRTAATVAMLLVTGFAGLVVHLNYRTPEAPYLLSQMTLLIVVLWAVAYSIYVLNKDRANALEEAEHAGFADGLTGLPNTRMMRRRATALLDARNERINRRTGLVLLDLDGFHAANMLRGHRVGDQLLVAVGSAMSSAAEPGHIVCRTGSDEFSVLVPDCTEAELSRLSTHYRRSALSAVDALNIPGININASVGTSLGDGGMSIDDLMSSAERSMYLEKAGHDRGSGQHRRQQKPEPAEPAKPSSEPRTRPTATRWDHLRWSNRSDQNRILSTFWVLSAIGVAISMQMPDAVEHNELLVNAVALFAFVSGIVIYLVPPATDFARQMIDVALATATLALAIAISGGATSPALPIQLLILIYIGWFLPLRSVIPVAVVSTIVVVLPMPFTTHVKMALSDVVAVYGGVIISLVLLAVLYYNRYYIERAHKLTTQLRSLDPRAGAYSRSAFEERMADELDSLSYGDRDALAVVMVDLGNFKVVSANHGRAVSDQLLTEVAAALARASRDEDCVARLGGDEFAVVAPGVDAESARALAQRLVAAIREMLAESELPVRDEIRPSAGFALYGMHGRTIDELVTAADIALTTARTSSRDPNRVSSFVVAL